MLGAPQSNLRPSSSNVSLSSNTSASSSTTQSHPLTSPKVQSTSQAFYSALTPSTSSSSIALSNQTANNVVRSRKTPQPQHQANSRTVDPEVTRPSLQRVTKKNSGILNEAIGKGKVRQSFDELSGNGLSGAGDGMAEGDAKEAEKEVLVHQIAKTDTLASVALQYGITPQALRLSNRLWANDSIHLRKHLHIPLDQCHLPSSSSIERVSRDEDGSLVIWERSPPLPSSSMSPLVEERGEKIWSPSARRAVSEMGGVSAWSSTADLLGLDSARNSIDGGDRDGKGKGKERTTGDPSSYLPMTNNPYSSSNPPSPPPPRMTSPLDFFGRSSPLPNFPQLQNGHNHQNGMTSPSAFSAYTDEPNWPPSRPESTDSEFSYASRSSPSLQPPSSTRRTMVVEKVKVSELKFFPKPVPSFSSSGDIDKTPTQSSIATFASQQDQTPHIGHGMKARRQSNLGFPDLGPLTNSLAKLVPGSTSNGVGGSQHWTKKWDIFDYGGEEEEAGGEFVMRGLNGSDGDRDGTPRKKRDERRARSVF